MYEIERRIVREIVFQLVLLIEDEEYTSYVVKLIVGNSELLSDCVLSHKLLKGRG